MNKKTLPVEENSDKPAETSSETIKLTVSEVEPEEPAASDPGSVVDDLYSSSVKEETKTEEVSLGDMNAKSNLKKSERSPKSGFWGFVVGLLIGGLVTGGIFNFIISPKSSGDQKETSSVTVAQTPAVEVTPEATEAPQQVDYSQYTVEVLNGSGVTGAAATVKSLIAGLNFSKIKTGNASVSDQEKTTIKLKESVIPSVFEEIKNLLSDYDVVLGESLENSADNDIQITVGTKK